MGQQKRERNLTGPNILLAVRRTEGLSKSREELAGYGLAQPGQRQEAGGRGKRQTQPQRGQRLPPGKQAPGSCLKTS